MVLVTAGETLKPGRYTLAMDFAAKFNRQAVGLYKMVARGEPYLFTQFEAIDARRAFPVWDEPEFKIPFQLTVTIPALYDAVSNTPVVSETKNGDAKTIEFARTKPLPSYLVALAVGQFDYTPILGMSVPGRIIAPKGQGHLSQTAAEITPPVLAALEKYFDGKHPFEKVDLLAVPEYWAGAMENPGAITFRDTILLLDPATATPSQRQSMARVVAHELAHMWFGDLVTMEWWDDLWLNESFADWMGDKITEQVFPQFEHAISEMGEVQSVMSADMRATTDPIRRREASPEEAMRNVGLAYNKGKAVLGMFEAWIGPEAFRQGVLAHLKANAWGNANAGQFFASLSKKAPAGTSAALETFIEQPGIPLVHVEVTGPNTLRLTQKRFATSAVKPETWKIPVTLRYSDGNTTRTKALMLDTASKDVRLEGDRIVWVFPHAEAAGYYRWQLDDPSMSALASNATQVLSPRERLAFIGNLGALFRAGELHGDAYLEHLGRFAGDADPHVLSSLLTALGQVRSTFDSPELRPRFAEYVRRTLGPALASMGYTPREGEPQPLTVLRPDVLRWLAAYGEDEAVWQFIRERLPKYLQDPASLHPTLAGLVLGMSATRGDEALFNEYKSRFENATLPAERSRYLSALGQFRDPALKQKARDYALSGSVRPTELFSLVGGTDTEEEREDLYQWVTANYDALTRKLPPNFAAGMPFVASGCNPERVERAREFFATRKSEGTDRQLARVAEQVNECAVLREREMDAVMRYLTQ
jgi:alanyl aminopeptidase